MMLVLPRDDRQQQFQKGLRWRRKNYNSPVFFKISTHPMLQMLLLAIGKNNFVLQDVLFSCYLFSCNSSCMALIQQCVVMYHVVLPELRQCLLEPPRGLFEGFFKTVFNIWMR